MIKVDKLNESLVKLTVDDNSLIGVIENSCRARIPNIEYTPAYKLGMITPYKNFYIIPDNFNSNEIIIKRGLLSPIMKLLSNDPYNQKFVGYSDEVTRNVSRECLKDYILNTLKVPFEPHSFQFDAIYDAIHSKMKTMILATGSGKSFIIYCMIRYFIDKVLKDDEKLLLIVPSIMLLNQMYSDFESYGFKDIDKYVGRLGGDYKVKSFDSKVNISTYQSLYRSPELFKDIKVIIEDEVHIAKSTVHDEIIFPSAINAEYRYGLTGTLPKDMCSKMTLASVFGEPKKYVSPRELIDKGLATDVKVNAIFLHHNQELSEILKHTKNYQKEVSTLLEYPKRTSIIGKLCAKASEYGNTIALFNRVEFGEKLAKEVVKHKCGVDIEDINILRKENPYNVYFITGASSSKDREYIRTIIENKDDAIILGTTSIISTGINIKKLHNLVFIQGGKSDININQAIGRILRTHNSKTRVNVYDFVDLSCKIGKSYYKTYSYKHFLERLSMYEENEYPVQEKHINLE